MKKLLMITLFLLTHLLAINTTAASLERIPLWGDTFYGMTLKELLFALPDLQTSPAGANDLNIKSDEQVLAKLNTLDIAGEKFSVWFIFNNDQLSRVTLTLIPQAKKTAENSTNEDINILYAHYVDLLTAKYGQPVKKTWQDYAPLNIRLRNTQWIKGLTNIELNVDKTQLGITYGAEYAEDLKQL